MWNQLAGYIGKLRVPVGDKLTNQREIQDKLDYTVDRFCMHNILYT